MKVVIDIPKDFTGDYIVDKFTDFFSRVIADIDCKGMCGRYEKKIAEMFLKVFDDSEEKISCNCQHNSDSRDNEPCHRCDSKQTNADRIKNMSDEELAEFNLCPHMVNWKKGNYDTCVHPNDKDACKKCMLDWLQSEAEYERTWTEKNNKEPSPCSGCKYEKSTNIKELLAFCTHCKRAYSHEEDREIHEDRYEEDIA